MIHLSIFVFQVLVCLFFHLENLPFFTLCIFAKTNNKAENVFGYSLKQGAPLVSNSPATDYEQVST